MSYTALKVFTQVLLLFYYKFEEGKYHVYLETRFSVLDTTQKQKNDLLRSTVFHVPS
jgi:hypothetical protein